MNKNKSLRLTIALFLALVGNNAHSTFESVCFFGVNSGGAGPTMFHAFTWNVLDAIIWTNAGSVTSVVPPTGITVLNNPRNDGYLLVSEGLEYSAGVFPAPIPPGLWAIAGTDFVYLIRIIPVYPFIHATAHPDNPFSCAAVVPV